MKVLNTENFKISFQDNLEDFVQKALENFEKQRNLIEQTFEIKISNLNSINVKIFSNQSDFFDYINQISENKERPSWLKGCFINGEIQMLVNISNDAEFQNRTFTLTHEFVHIIIKNEFYKKYNIKRMRWFDESYACFIDGRTRDNPPDFFKKKTQKIKINHQNIDLNSLNDAKKLKTDDFDAYDVFQIIGKYIFENNLEKEYLELLKNDSSKLQQLSNNILIEAIKHIENL